MGGKGGGLTLLGVSSSLTRVCGRRSVEPNGFAGFVSIASADEDGTLTPVCRMRTCDDRGRRGRIRGAEIGVEHSASVSSHLQR